MPYSLYICLQDEDKIVSFAIDADSGQLTAQGQTPVAGGPSVLAFSPDRRVLYAGHRTRPAISSFRIDQGSGELTLQRTVVSADAPTFLAADRTGRYLLSAYYQGGYAAVHPLGDDGAVGAPAADRPSDPKLAIPSRTGGARRPAALLLSSQSRCCLFLGRTGLQRHNLSSG